MCHCSYSILFTITLSKNTLYLTHQRRDLAEACRDFSVKARCLLHQHITLYVRYVFCLTRDVSLIVRVISSSEKIHKTCSLPKWPLNRKRRQRISPNWKLTGQARSDYKKPNCFLPVPWEEESISLSFFPVYKPCFSSSTGRNDRVFKIVLKRLAEY